MRHVTEHLTAEELAVFGKVRGAREFVRRASGSAGVALQRFVADGFERAQARFPEQPVYFLARLDDAGPLQCGAAIPSADAVGRRFPLAASIILDGGFRDPGAAAGPVALQPFLDGLVSALEAASGADLDALPDWLTRIERPHPLLLTQAIARCTEALRHERTDTFAARVFGEGRSEQLVYALWALTLAAAQAQERGDAVYLDCPITSDIDVVVWCELAEQALGAAERSVGLIWTEQPPRLLLTFGALDAAALAPLVGGSHGTLWPLVTARPEALTRARTELGAHLRTCVERNVTLLELVASGGE